MCTGGGDPVCECTGLCTLGVENVVECTLGVQIVLIVKINQSETTKPNFEYIIKIDQSQITPGKIVSKGKMPLTSK